MPLRTNPSYANAALILFVVVVARAAHVGLEAGTVTDTVTPARRP
ncbi:hypothetical protein QA942_19390 [Streptomyces sp. B21-106]